MCFFETFQTSTTPRENKEVMTDNVDTVERSQTRTLIRHEDFDEEDDDRDVVTVGRHKRPKEFVEQISSTNLRRAPNVEHLTDEGSSESTAPPSRATTDPASTLRDSGYSDVTGSRNFTPGSNPIKPFYIFRGKKYKNLM